MMAPLTSFCCGCQLSVGAAIVLACHLAECIIFIACACLDLIALQPTLLSGWSAPSQLVYTGFCMVGIPIILVGLYGVATRTEANVRAYFYYYTLCFAINSLMMIYWCLFENLCDPAGGLSNMFMRDFGGEAFLCGTLSIAKYAGTAVVVAIEVYCLWILYSLCEDVHKGLNGPELSGLIPRQDDTLVRNIGKHAERPAGIVGFASSKLPGPHPHPYGAFSTTGGPGR